MARGNTSNDIQAMICTSTSSNICLLRTMIICSLGKLSYNFTQSFWGLSDVKLNVEPFASKSALSWRSWLLEKEKVELYFLKGRLHRFSIGKRTLLLSYISQLKIECTPHEPRQTIVEMRIDIKEKPLGMCCLHHAQPEVYTPKRLKINPAQVHCFTRFHVVIQVQHSSSLCYVSVG